jgi:creatinine amidohydrolase
MTEVLWSRLKAREIRERQAAGAVVVVPVGSTEQHGPHLPVQVDALVAGAIAEHAARLTDPPALVAPTVWVGLAEHHVSFGGTLTVAFETFHRLLRDLVDGLARQGFARVFLLNAHGGNEAALNVIVGELAIHHGIGVATAGYWSLVPEGVAAILERQANVQHACELETSVLLALCPELVDMAAVAGVDAPADAEEPARGTYRWRPMSHWTASGVVGVPSAATAEKGRELLDLLAGALAERLGDARLWR